MEETLGELRHARDGFYAEVAQTGYSPGVLVSGYEASPVGGVTDFVKHELGICLHGVDA